MRYEDRWEFDARMPQFAHGIWDSVAEEYAARDLSTSVSSWQAAVLSLRYEADAERPDARARFLDPPTHVELHITVKRTEAALLHMWALEADGGTGS